jgi:hypothetical protein
MNFIASRRDVLKGGGALVVSFSLAPVGDALAQGPAKPVTLTEVDRFWRSIPAARFWFTPQGRSRHRHHHGARADGWPRSSTCHSPRSRCSRATAS